MIKVAMIMNDASPEGIMHQERIINNVKLLANSRSMLNNYSRAQLHTSLLFTSSKIKWVVLTACEVVTSPNCSMFAGCILVSANRIRKAGRNPSG